MTENVHFVRPHFKTGWGKFSVIDAMISALELLVRLPNAPDWVVLLSCADYPIKSADKIVRDLNASPFDVHMRHEKIIYNQFERDWQRLCYDRYCSLKFRVPSLDRALLPKWRTVTIRHPAIASQFSPFTDKFLCFAGEHWFCARLHAAQYLIDFTKRNPAVADHYRRRDAYTVIPEELYYQTILCNTGFKISQNIWRYIDWNVGNSPHPRTFCINDFEALRNSDAHFARKFDIDLDVQILDALDGHI